MAIISLLICGLLFPLVVTGFAQLIMPFQANGSILQLNGRNIGSYLIAQNFSFSPMFFQSRNSSLSASGVDPDITLQDAYSQTSRISNATGNRVSVDALKLIVDQNVEWTFGFFGDAYVNVLNLNLILIRTYPSVYGAFA